jgi:hypothetical protein
MRWIVRIVLLLVVAGFLGLVGHAYLGDLSPDRSLISTPVTLDAD